MIKPTEIIFVTKPSKRAMEAEHKLKRALSGNKLALPEPLVVAIGGDGTMLMAIKEYGLKPVVFAGISAGALGLLQTVEVTDIPVLVESLTKGTYELINAPLLEVAYCRPVSDNALEDKRLDVLGYAFNDISIERAKPRATRLHLKINGSDGTFIGDGIIFATPLGSTAYSLAAGGPVIDVDIQKSFVVTPNNPHFSALYSSLQRPHVLGRKRRVRIEVNKEDVGERPAQLAIDGRVVIPEITAPIVVGLSNHYVRLLQLGPDVLRNRIEDKRLGRL